MIQLIGWRSRHFLPLGLALCLLTPIEKAQSADFAMWGSLTGTCRVTTENVEMHYKLTDFRGVGVDQEWTPFNITSAGCDDGVTSDIRIAFTGEVDPVDPTLFKVQGVGGVGLEVQTSNARPVSPDGTSAPVWTPGDVGFVYSYRARFSQHSATVTPGVGRVTAVITVTLQ